MDRQKSIRIIAIIIFLTVIAMVFFLLMNKETYSLNLPKTEEVTRIMISTDTVKKEVTSIEEIKDIIYVLEGNERTTKKESINDSPVNAETPIKIEFHFQQSGGSILYIYTQRNQYYLEQPYNGIYPISGDEYNSIAKYVL